MLRHVRAAHKRPAEDHGESEREAGATKLLCIIHEQGNLGLNQRCDGAKKGFGGEVENLQVAGASDISTSLTEIQWYAGGTARRDVPPLQASAARRALPDRHTPRSQRGELGRYAA